MNSTRKSANIRKYCWIDIPRSGGFVDRQRSFTKLCTFQFHKRVLYNELLVRTSHLKYQPVRNVPKCTEGKNTQMRRTCWHQGNRFQPFVHYVFSDWYDLSFQWVVTRKFHVHCKLFESCRESYYLRAITTIGEQMKAHYVKYVNYSQNTQLMELCRRH